MQKRCNGAKRNGIFSKCLQKICQYYAFQRNATTSNRPLVVKSHPAGMRVCCAIFVGISLRLCSILLRSFRITFAAYLPTRIKSLRDFLQSSLNYMTTGTTCISFQFFMAMPYVLWVSIPLRCSSSYGCPMGLGRRRGICGTIRGGRCNTLASSSWCRASGRRC